MWYRTKMVTQPDCQADASESPWFVAKVMINWSLPVLQCLRQQFWYIVYICDYAFFIWLFNQANK